MTPEFIVKAQEVMVVAIAAGVLLLLEHIAPWERVFGQKPQPPWTYIMGTATYGIPLCVLLVRWGSLWELGLWAAVVIASGLPVIVGYDVRMRLEFKSLKAELSKALRLADEIVANLRGKGK